MSRLKVRHLGVTDAFGRLCGALSARDLLRQRAEEAVWLGDEIDQAEDVAGLRPPGRSCRCSPPASSRKAFPAATWRR